MFQDRLIGFLNVLLYLVVVLHRHQPEVGNALRGLEFFEVEGGLCSSGLRELHFLELGELLRRRVTAAINELLAAVVEGLVEFGVLALERINLLLKFVFESFPLVLHIVRLYTAKCFRATNFPFTSCGRLLITFAQIGPKSSSSSSFYNSFSISLSHLLLFCLRYWSCYWSLCWSCCWSCCWSWCCYCSWSWSWGWLSGYARHHISFWCGLLGFWCWSLSLFHLQ